MNVPREDRKGGERRIITGLDIGTSKIGVIIGEVEKGDRVQILGVGLSPSEGLRQGVPSSVPDYRLYGILISWPSL